MIEDSEATNGKPKFASGNFTILDVNDIQYYKAERIAGGFFFLFYKVKIKLSFLAKHYDKTLISRVNYENKVIEEARKENRALLV